MAKYGEGDSRWIVEDRADGANVHNWHWAETNCLEWSRNLLTDLLSNLTVLDGEGNLFVKTKKVDKVDGEAYVNVRKGKIIPGYEISVAVPWEDYTELQDTTKSFVSFCKRHHPQSSILVVVPVVISMVVLVVAIAPVANAIVDLVCRHCPYRQRHRGSSLSSSSPSPMP